MGHSPVWAMHSMRCTAWTGEWPNLKEVAQTTNFCGTISSTSFLCKIPSSWVKWPIPYERNYVYTVCLHEIAGLSKCFSMSEAICRFRSASAFSSFKKLWDLFYGGILTGNKNSSSSKTVLAFFLSSLSTRYKSSFKYLFLLNALSDGGLWEKIVFVDTFL